MTYDERVARAAEVLLPGAQPLACRLLALMRPGRIATSRYLLDALWPDQPSRDNASLASVVKRLRPFLPPGFAIQAEAGIGYRLHAPRGWVAPWAAMPPERQAAAVDDLLTQLRAWADRHGVAL